MISTFAPKKVCKFSNYIWYRILAQLDLKFILTKLRSLDKRTRELFAQPNCKLLSIFIRSYGLCMSLQKSELSFELMPFFTKMEQNMIRAKKEKDMADSFY